MDDFKLYPSVETIALIDSEILRLEPYLSGQTGYTGYTGATGSAANALQYPVVNITTTSTLSNYTEYHINISALSTFYLPANPPNGSKIIACDSGGNFNTNNALFVAASPAVIQPANGGGGQTYLCKIQYSWLQFDYNSASNAWILLSNTVSGGGGSVTPTSFNYSLNSLGLGINAYV